MGNQNCKDCSNSILFPEEDFDEMKEWMEYSATIRWSYPPSCFPETELRHVQPDYELDKKNTQNNNMRKSVLLVNSDYKMNKDTTRKSHKKVKSVKEEVYLEDSTNNNVIKEKQTEEMEESEKTQGMDCDKVIINDH